MDCVVVDASITGTFYNNCHRSMSHLIDCHPIFALGLKVYLKVWECRGVSRPAPGGKNLPLYPLGCKAWERGSDAVSEPADPADYETIDERPLSKKDGVAGIGRQAFKPTIKNPLGSRLVNATTPMSNIATRAKKHTAATGRELSYWPVRAQENGSPRRQADAQPSWDRVA